MYTLKQARKRAGLTQWDVATALNVTHVTLSNWETGKTRPNANRLMEMCELYHVTPYEIDLRDRKQTAGKETAEDVGRDIWEEGPGD